MAEHQLRFDIGCSQTGTHGASELMHVERGGVERDLDVDGRAGGQELAQIEQLVKRSDDEGPFFLSDFQIFFTHLQQDFLVVGRQSPKIGVGGVELVDRQSPVRGIQTVTPPARSQQGSSIFFVVVQDGIDERLVGILVCLPADQRTIQGHFEVVDDGVAQIGDGVDVGGGGQSVELGPVGFLKFTLEFDVTAQHVYKAILGWDDKLQRRDTGRKRGVLDFAPIQKTHVRSGRLEQLRHGVLHQLGARNGCCRTHRRRRRCLFLLLFRLRPTFRRRFTRPSDPPAAWAFFYSRPGSVPGAGWAISPAWVARKKYSHPVVLCA